MATRLTDLVEALRAAGFRAGPAETVAAGRLLERLGRERGASEDPFSWRLKLRPVFATNREEQARFDAIFQPWAEALRRETAQAPTPEAPAPVEPGPGRWQSRLRRFMAFTPVLLVLGVSAMVLWGEYQRRTAAPGAKPAASATSAAASAAVPSAPASAAQPPAPVRKRGSAMQVGGFHLAWHEVRELRTPWLWAATLLPLAAFWLLRGAPPLAALQPLALLRRRGRSAKQVRLDTQELEQRARALLPGLEPRLSAQLQRHVRSEGGERAPLARRRRVDERRTVEAMLRQPGTARLVHRPAPLRPSYLVLVDLADEADPRGRLFIHWAERLRRLGLEVELRSFRSEPPPEKGQADAAPLSHRIATQGLDDGQDSPRRLDQLADPPDGQRLVVVGDVATWVDPEGAWRPWFKRARLHRWSQRAFFTPLEMRDWTERDDAVERPERTGDLGFLLLPMDEAALGAWSEMLVRGELPYFSLSEPERWPRELAGKPDNHDWQAEPTAEVRERLLAQLQIYLGDTGFRWLCLLAVPPLVRWELTLLLGERLFGTAEAEGGLASLNMADAVQRARIGRAYRRLARLPWLRGQRRGSGETAATGEPRLPDWLRLRLLDELSSEALKEARDAASEQLSKLEPTGTGLLELQIEMPPVQDPAAEHKAPKAEEGTDTCPDLLYLGILSGMTPRQLALRAPETWKQRWLPPETISNATRLARWAEAKWARLVYEEGQPWAPRLAFAWTVALGLAGVGALLVFWLPRQPPTRVPAVLEPWLFEHRSERVAPYLPGGARAVALAPNGRSAAALTASGDQVHVFDTTDGRTLAVLQPAHGAATVLFDGNQVVTCAGPGGPSAWTRSGAVVAGVRDDDPDRAARGWRVSGAPAVAGTDPKALCTGGAEVPRTGWNGSLPSQTLAAMGVPFAFASADGEVPYIAAGGNAGGDILFTKRWLAGVEVPGPTAVALDQRPLEAVATTESGRVAAVARAGEIELLVPDARGTPLRSARGVGGEGPIQQLSLDRAANQALLLNSDGRLTLARRAQPALGNAGEDMSFAAISRNGRWVVGLDRRNDFAVRLSTDESLPSQRLPLPFRPADVASGMVWINPGGDEIALVERTTSGANGINAEIVLWRGKFTTQRWTPQPFTGLLTVAYLDDGRLAVITKNGSYHRLPTAGGEAPPPVNLLDRRGLDELLAARIHPSGALALTIEAGRGDIRMVLRNAEAEVREISRQQFAGMSLGSLGRTLWVIGGQDRLERVSAEAGDPVPMLPFVARTADRLWEHDDEYNVLATFDGQRLRFFNSLTGAELPVRGRTGEVKHLKPLPGRRWLVVHDDGQARVEDLNGAPPPPPVWMPSDAVIRSASVSADGRRLLIHQGTWLAQPAPAPEVADASASAAATKDVAAKGAAAAKGKLVSRAGGKGFEPVPRSAPPEPAAAAGATRQGEPIGLNYGPVRWFALPGAEGLVSPPNEAPGTPVLETHALLLLAAAQALAALATAGLAARQRRLIMALARKRADATPPRVVRRTSALFSGPEAAERAGEETPTGPAPREAAEQAEPK